ncbi:MAG TPA: glycosyltransferase, partial [Candidatus Pelethomonas intestinigallinarum]|nr:glycosyltransferase [Candidatus Pelethomonas intestinigallinarum]
MDLSLIIPVYNERRAIGPCLENLEALKGPVEVIFADGGSTDGTTEAIGDRYPVLSCPKGRARQMNAAAAAAAGDVLWFS